MGEERKDQRKGNHPIAFGTREKGMKDDGNGGGSVREGIKQENTIGPDPACGHVCYRSLRVGS